MRAYFKIPPPFFVGIFRPPPLNSFALPGSLSFLLLRILPRQLFVLHNQKLKLSPWTCQRMYVHVLSRIRRAGNSLLAISSCTIILGLPFAVLATGPDKMDGVISISTTTGPGAIYHT